MSRYTPEEKAARKEEKRAQKAENRLLMLVGFLGGLILNCIVIIIFVVWAMNTNLKLF